MSTPNKLIIPSLGADFGQFNFSQGNIDQNDAIAKAKGFTDMVRNSLKCFNTNPKEKLDINFFHGVIPAEGLTEDFIKAVEKQFLKSEVPKVRGYRVLYIGNDVIGVGTTILYNPRRAALNFTDPDTFSQLLLIKEAFDTAGPTKTDDPTVVQNVTDVASQPTDGTTAFPPLPAASVIEPVAKAYVDIASRSTISEKDEAAVIPEMPKKRGWIARLFGW